jgi:hypothetical protein
MPPSTRSRSSSRSRKDKGDFLISTPVTTDDEHEDDPVHQRVHRDVRAIGRRLDRHQAASTNAINMLQGEMSKITNMVANMQFHFSRLTTTDSTPPADLTAAGQNRNFVTPPPLPSKQLSPILEETTGATTNLLPNPPPFPPNLGKLTPDQLPLTPSQTRIQPVRQNNQTTTNQTPITSSMPSSSNNNAFTQVTNPNTQPHACRR